MGRARTLTIAGQDFNSMAEAESHFQDKRPEVKASGPVSDGELFNQLSEVYTRYCAASPGWELNGREITAFSVDYELRKNRSSYAQHLCYRVHFSNKEVRPFSVPKALKAIK